jgi:hypothetical protein
VIFVPFHYNGEIRQTFLDYNENFPFRYSIASVASIVHKGASLHAVVAELDNAGYKIVHDPSPTYELKPTDKYAVYEFDIFYPLPL